MRTGAGGDAVELRLDRTRPGRIAGRSGTATFPRGMTKHFTEPDDATSD